MSMNPLALRRRRAARMVVTDPLGRILLFRFDHWKGALAGTGYWATPGGGLEPGETFAQAAIRELEEETGILVAEVGPLIAKRELVMQLDDGEHVLEEERYFHVAAPDDRLSLNGWSDAERDCLSGYRWWNPGDLGTTSDRISPENLLQIMRKIRI